MISPENQTAMDELVLQQFQIQLEFLWILLPIASIMHMDEGLTKDDAMFVKKIAEKVREEVEEFLDF